MNDMNQVYEFERETVFRGKWVGIIYWQRDRESGLWRHRPDGSYTHTEHAMLDVEWAVDRACLVDGLPGQIMNAMRYW
jgi:hypothetical protein